MDYNAVIPEFMVSNIEQSRSFYCDLLGFTIEYQRLEEKFLFLSLEDLSLIHIYSKRGRSLARNASYILL